jgi:hypothetical protein
MSLERGAIELAEEVERNWSEEGLNEELGVLPGEIRGEKEVLMPSCMLWRD